MLDGVDREVYVEVWPVEVVGMWPFDVQDRGHGGGLEPWELLEGQEQLSLLQEEPEAVLRDVGHLSC